MLLDGISVQGSYHDRNQDSFLVKKLNKGFVAVLSDGLGSKKHSQAGARAICESVVEIAEARGSALEEADPIAFVREAYARWKDKLKGYTLSDCYATMLVFLIYAGKGFAIRLGDGFIGFWADGEIRVLYDKKADYFANETDCLTENLLYERLEICDFEISELRGGVMCSDGVGIGNMEEKELMGFTKDFIEGYCEMSREEISADVQSWLSDWPGADDKTLNYFVSERIG